ncbi:MAG: CapA family protein [Elusimicrobia bacterium]|nr:CapA family protein [Elusimicrobiota bacterium]
MVLVAALSAAATLASASTPAVSTSAAVAASTAPAEVEVLLVAVGDIRLDGPVAEAARKAGPAGPAAAVKDLLAGDIVFGNLEEPLTTRGAKTVKTWNFRARPAQLKLLKTAGFNLLNVANNHVWDYGREGFEDTLKALEKGDWDFVGGGRDRAAAEQVRTFEYEGLIVGFIGLTSTHPEAAWAGKSRPGVAYSDFARMGEIVGRAKKECDVLVVSFHGGTELAEDPNEIQKAVARAAIDAGADLFLGHHPHVLQPVEVYKGKPILYSLGNFLFVSPTPTTRASVVARIRLGRDGVRAIDLTPVDTNYGRPKPAPPELAAAAKAALDRMGALTARPDLVRFAEAPRP